MEYSLVSRSRLRIGVAATGAKNWNLGPIQRNSIILAHANIL